MRHSCLIHEFHSCFRLPPFSYVMGVIIVNFLSTWLGRGCLHNWSKIILGVSTRVFLEAFKSVDWVERLPSIKQVALIQSTEGLNMTKHWFQVGGNSPTWWSLIWDIGFYWIYVSFWPLGLNWNIISADLGLISFIWANVLLTHLYMCTSYWFHFFGEPWLIIQVYYTRMMSKREKMPGPLIISLVNELTNSNSRLYSQFLLCYGKRRRKRGDIWFI